MSVDSWGVDYVLVGEGSPVLQPPFHYRDPRSDKPYKRAIDEIGHQAVMRSDLSNFSALDDPRVALKLISDDAVVVISILGLLGLTLLVVVVPAEILQLRGLILHKRNPRRDHNCRLLQHERRQLVTKRLASAGRHHHANVAAAKQAADDFFLPRPERIVAPVML